MNPLYPYIARRAGFRCEYCRAPQAVANGTFEVEHVYPVSRGGSDDPSNLARACHSCNLHKGDRVAGADPLTGQAADLFDPRSDRWPDHFAFDPDTGELTGLTPAARATIAVLDMNNAFQIAARHVWVRLMLYP